MSKHPLELDLSKAPAHVKSRIEKQLALKKTLDLRKAGDRDIFRMRQETDARNEDLEHHKREQEKRQKDSER